MRVLVSVFIKAISTWEHLGVNMGVSFPFGLNSLKPKIARSQLQPWLAIVIVSSWHLFFTGTRDMAANK